MIHYRPLNPSDLAGLASIDRSDDSNHWCIVKDGVVVLQERTFRHPGFSQAQWDDIASELGDKLARDEVVLIGAYDSELLVGIAGLDTDERYGNDCDLYNFGPLWISREYRARGIGRQLFTMVRKEAERMDIDGMYVSATPVPGTVGFYTRMGCQLLIHPDPHLLAKEPEDIHMVLELPNKPDAGDVLKATPDSRR